MMQRPAARHLVIFLKAPVLGQVKRRLAAEIGTVPAWVFYRRAATTVVRRLAGDPRWRTWLAISPDAMASIGRWWPPRITRIPQGRGDLGRRMDRALRRPPGGPVVLVGSDIPDIAASDIVAAFRSLGTGDWVFGPAEDGGYWLVGTRRRPRFPYVFAGVRWSTEHALRDTLANVRGQRVALIRTLSDVDTAADLRRRRAT